MGQSAEETRERTTRGNEWTTSASETYLAFGEVGSSGVGGLTIGRGWGNLLLIVVAALAREGQGGRTGEGGRGLGSA